MACRLLGGAISRNAHLHGGHDGVQITSLSSRPVQNAGQMRIKAECFSYNSKGLCVYTEPQYIFLLPYYYIETAKQVSQVIRVNP